MNGYLTLARGEDPINKAVFITADGEVDKRAPRPLYDVTAETVHVPDVQAMEALLQRIADDPCAVIISGFVPGTENGKAYRILTLGALSEALGQPYSRGFVEIDGEQCIARTKDNYAPSSWWQIDRDVAKGLPDEWATMSEADYIAAVGEIIPGFAEAGKVWVASTTGRVLVDGKPLASAGGRFWFQVEDPADIDGFGSRVKIWAAVQGWGFMKLDRNDKGVLWSIFDCSVFSPERVVFDGKPVTGTRGASKGRLSVGDPDIRAVEGGRVDTTQVPTASHEQRQQVSRQFNLKISHTRAGSLSVVNKDYLTLDTEVETQHHGVVTVRDFYESGDAKWRCQSTFRDSNSWNGGLVRGHDGMPMLIDYGGNTRYELRADEKAELFFEEVSHG